jgi:hypothetical protein
MNGHRFEGKADPSRRDALDHNAEAVLREGWREYRKATTTWARRMTEPFEVNTEEGLMQGAAGDYLAVGAAGEMYPIKGDLFAQTHEEVSR